MNYSEEEFVEYNDEESNGIFSLKKISNRVLYIGYKGDGIWSAYDDNGYELEDTDLISLVKIAEQEKDTGVLLCDAAETLWSIHKSRMKIE